MSKLSFFLCAVAALLLSVALAQTRGGTLITNTASVSFTDADGNDRTTVSNTVEIFVQTVYSFNIEPDEERAPSGDSATANNFAGYEEIDGNNDLTDAVGKEITFNYTLTNDTNNAIEVTLEVLQATTDNFNLSGVTFTVQEAAGAAGFGAVAVGDTLAASNGVYTLEQNGAYTVTVTGTIPAGAQGNEFALVDLVATNAGTPGETAPTVGPNLSYENNNVSRVTVAEAPVIGAANTATSVNNGDGSYTVTYTLSVENFSNTALNGVQLTDNLAATFTNATSFSVTGVTSDDFTVNPGFTGTPTGATGEPSLNLLAADQSLATGATGTVTLTVRVVPGAKLGPYENQVTASGTTPGGEFTDDLSTNSDDPDQNGAIPANDGDGDPRNTNSLTPVTFTETPVLGVAKGASTVENNPAGGFDVTYTVWLQNSGNVTLSGVQVTDALTATFPAPATFTVGDPTTTGNLTPNPNFDGDADTNLLGAGSTLAADTTETVSFTVNFVPNGLTGPFANSATGNGTSPAGIDVTDVSQNGDDPDPDADDDPTNNSEPTPISLTEDPALGVAKDVTVTDAGNGTFTATFTVTVENLGNVNLNSAQVTDNLNATFPDPATFSVSAAPSSPTLTPNPDFNGASDTALLAGTDVLTPGQTAVVTFSVTFDPNGAASFENTANGSATSPEGIDVADGSQSGTDPDPDGNGSGADNTDPTPVVVPEAPVIGLAKALGTVTNNGNGSYTVPYTLTAENFGNVRLNGVQITDDFAATFVGATFTVGSVTSGDFTVNDGFNGGSDQNLLVGSDGLAVGAQGSVVVTVTVTPGANLGPYNNQANTTATSPGGNSVADASANGGEPDANGNGDPTDDSAPTPVTFAEAPALGVAKAATESVSATGFPGQFESTVTITLRNLGDAPLNSVSVTDDLAAIFGAATVEAVTGVAGTGTLQADPAFNGGTVTELLLPDSTLPTGATETVTFTVRFDPNGETGPFNNTATGSASSPAGTTVNDDSTLGSDPVAGDEPAPTPITFTTNPVIGVAKAATVTDFGNANPNAGPVTPGVVELTFTLENLGDVNLSSLSLTDDLNTTFGAGNYTVTSGPTVAGSTTVTASTTYDGGANTELLGAGSSLDIRETATVTLTVNVTAPGAYTNQAAATGTGPGGAVTTDLSDEGANPDSDGDGVADEAGENDPTPITFDALRADKSARVCEDADCNTVLDPDADGGEVAPGQYIEYTVTAENLGGATLTNVTISDAVPLNTVFAYSASTSASAECNSGAGFAACPTGTSGDTDESVAAVQLPVGALAASEIAELTFVVLVP